MGKGGIFNVGNVLGAIEDELEEYSEAPGVDITQSSFAELEAGADVTGGGLVKGVVKPDLFAKPTQAPSKSGFWSGLTDTQRVLVGLAAAAGVYFLWKGMTKKVRPASYAQNKRRRRAKRNPYDVVTRRGGRSKYMSLRTSKGAAQKYAGLAARHGCSVYIVDSDTGEVVYKWKPSRGKGRRR